jgi:hypothetical protein
MKTTDAIETYELRRTFRAGRANWQWRVKGSTDCTYANTRKEAEEAIKADAHAKGAAFFIEEKGL